MKRTEPTFSGLFIIVPTRNRAQLARLSIQSATRHSGLDVRILVSDNSTNPAEQTQLETYCKLLPGDAHVSYIRPPHSMPMAEHWNWALKQALHRTQAEHFAILTDRFILRHGSLSKLIHVLTQYPDHILVYGIDSVHDHTSPCRVSLGRSTDRLYWIDSSRLLEDTSRLHSLSFIPVLLNSVTTRTSLESVRSTFGDYCVSIAPDYAHGFRTLATQSTILYLDSYLSTNWGRLRSNGMSHTRGVDNSDSTDYRASFENGLVYSATPVPKALLTNNAIAHEYVTVQQSRSGLGMPPLD